MDKERYQLIRRIFLEARDRPIEERSTYLDQACSEDSGLRAEVHKLLTDEEKASGDSDFLKESPVGRVLPKVQDGPIAPPKQIGRYRILRVLGHGGMGIVYEAEQDRPKRRVALKLIRPDLLSPEAQRRFELEVELLGRLKHPGIAAIHDAGTVETPLGCQPYFAMELIEGDPLLSYVASKGLGLHAKLRLFLDICQAIQHAHQNGIIHRDLKPGNILVNADGKPRILDFGVAKATDADIHGTAVQTNVGGVLGTFQYMSPEQAAGESRTVDTRADVYSLGVILYELLTGGLPYDVSRKAILEAARVVCETPPARPSTMSRAIRGDLETIVMKTLDKDRERRYGSVDALSDDVQRYMEHRPIEARPQSVLYQLKKLAWRRKGLVGGVTAALLALVAGTVVISVLAIEAQAQRDTARIERASATAALGLLEDALVRTMPFPQEQEPTIKEFLSDAEDATIEKREAIPVAAAKIHTVIGEVYYRWRELGPSERNHRQAFALRMEHLGPDHEDTLATMNNLAVTLKTMKKLDEAEELQTRALEGRTRLFGEDDFRTVTSLNNMASLRLSQGKHEEAEALFRETIERLDRTLGPDNEYTLTARLWRGFALTQLGRLDEAEAVQRSAVETLQAHPPEDPKFQHAALDALILTLKRQEKWDEAASLQRELLNLMAESGGRAHPRYSRIACQLAISLQKLGKIDEAEKTFEDLLGMQLGIIEKSMLPADAVRDSVKDWAYCLSTHRDGQIAIERLRSFAQRARAKLGQDHWYTMIVDYYLAVTLVKAGGSSEEARGVLQRVDHLVKQHSKDGNYQVLGDHVQKHLASL